MDINVNASKKFNIDFNIIIILYRHYKEYVLPLSIILCSAIVLFLVVFPQIQGYFNAENQLRDEQRKLGILKSNYNLLSNLNQTDIDLNLKILSLTLPSSKDFAGVINAITSSASNTGVFIGDFNFQVGDLSQVLQGVTSYPSLQITVNLNGNVQELSAFMTNLYKTVPISEITSVKVNQTTSVLTILFYYKPFPPKTLSEERPVLPLSVKEKSLLEDVSTWRSTDVSAQFFLPSVSSSDSATTGDTTISNGSPF